MRTADRDDRDREAYTLAAAYCAGNSASPYSVSPVARTTTVASKKGGFGTSRRPTSARSTRSRPMALGRNAVGGRASSARSRHGWAGEIDQQLSLGLEFRKRREDTARRRRMLIANGAGGTVVGVNDLEALWEENRKLKVALSSMIEENKRYRVNKARLEGELLRADGKAEILLGELDQAPGNRDQRLISAARREVETCAVVRTLANQKGHLQHLLALQERELETIKRTKEWSAVMEMTAATEEYYAEIQRLQKLLAQCQQQQKAGAQKTRASPARQAFQGGNDEDGEATREEYIPHRCESNRRRNSGVDDTIWIRSPEFPDQSVLVPSPIYGRQDTQDFLDVEPIASSAGGEEHWKRNNRDRLQTEHSEDFLTGAEDQSGYDSLRHKLNVSVRREVHHHRCASPKRRVSPPGRAQVSTRVGQKALDNGSQIRSPADPRSSRRVAQQVPRSGLGRQPEGGSGSHASIRVKRTTARTLNARTAAVGLDGRRPLSAPRRRKGMNTRSAGNARRADSLSSFSEKRSQEPPVHRTSAGLDGSDACIDQQPAARISSQGRARDYVAPVVPIPKESSSWEKADVKQTSSSVSRTKKRNEIGDSDSDGDGGKRASVSAVIFPRSSQSVGGDPSFQARHDDIGGNSEDPVSLERSPLASSTQSLGQRIPAASLKSNVTSLLAPSEQGRVADAGPDKHLCQQDAGGKGYPGDPARTVGLQSVPTKNTEGNESGRTIASSNTSTRVALDDEAARPSGNLVEAAPESEGDSARPESIGNSYDTNIRGNDADLMTGERNTSDNDTIGNDKRDQQKAAPNTAGDTATKTAGQHQDRKIDEGAMHNPTVHSGRSGHNLAALDDVTSWSSGDSMGASNTEDGSARTVSTDRPHGDTSETPVGTMMPSTKDSTNDSDTSSKIGGDGRPESTTTDGVPSDPPSDSCRHINHHDSDGDKAPHDPGSTGEDSTVQNDVSNVTQESYEDETAAVEMKNLLFDDDHCSDENGGGGVGPLSGESSAAPSEYGDDFDDDLEDDT